MTGENGPGRSSGCRFKLATYNVQNLGRADNPGAVYDAKLAFLANVVRRLDADLIVVDEVREEQCFHELAEAVGTYAERFLGDPPEDHRRIQIGILSRLPVQTQGQWHDFPAVIPGTAALTRLRFRRPVPWIVAQLPNRERLFVAAVHLKSQRSETESVPDSEPGRRREILGRSLAVVGRTLEAAGLRCLLDEAMEFGTAEHYAVIGDFNDGPDSEAVNIVAGTGEDDPDIETQDSWRLSSVSGRMTARVSYSYVGRKRQALLDHILVSQNLSLGIRAVGVENQLLEAREWRRSDRERVGYPRSDHAPVWAVFELPGG